MSPITKNNYLMSNTKLYQNKSQKMIFGVDTLNTGKAEKLFATEVYYSEICSLGSG